MSFSRRLKHFLPLIFNNSRGNILRSLIQFLNCRRSTPIEASSNQVIPIFAPDRNHLSIVIVANLLVFVSFFLRRFILLALLVFLLLFLK